MQHGVNVMNSWCIMYFLEGGADKPANKKAW